MREKTLSGVEVIPLHNEEGEPLDQVASNPLASQNCTEIFYLLYFKTMQATQSVDGSWTPSIGDCD